MANKNNKLIYWNSFKMETMEMIINDILCINYTRLNIRPLGHVGLYIWFDLNNCIVKTYYIRDGIGLTVWWIPKDKI